MSPGATVNEALRNALAAKGIDRLDVAANLQVDPKTVERWLSGRLPHPSSRAALAELLDVAEEEIWPSTDEPHARRFGPEIRAVYPHRWAVPRDVWHKLFASAKHEIDILDESGLFLFDDADMLKILAAKADAGAHIRISLGDPGSPEVILHGENEGTGDSATTRIRNAQALLKPLAARDGVDLHLHRKVLYSSIFRADNQLLSNPHIYGIPAATAPILHLCRSTDATLFSTYLDSFEQAWGWQAS
jgi:transcriptional regulator with XRE-family HTH domain